MEFKVGDRVQSIASYPKNHYGRLATVLGIDDDSDVLIQFDYNGLEECWNMDSATLRILVPEHFRSKVKGGKNCLFVHRSDIRLARIKDTEIARRLYPGYTILGNGWLEVV